MTHLTYNTTLLTRTALSLALLSVSTGLLANQTVSYTYNTLGLVETIDGKRTDVSDITTFTYGTAANLTAVTDALGHVTQITSYDLSGRPLTIIDANGATTTLSYDVRGRLLSQDVAGSLTQYSYDAVGNVQTITLVNGEVISYHYDSAHRPIGYSDALGNKVTYTLDAAGNKIEETITDSSATLTRTHQYIYDELSRLRSDIGAASQTATLDYDVNNNLTSQTDANTNPTNYAFDALDRLIDTTDAALGHTSYTYDERDNLISVTDAKGSITTYSYDAFDNLISQTSPDTGITTYTYDDAGNRVSQTDARGVTTQYSYDALNRLTSVSYPDITQNISYTYDENSAGQNGIGRLTSQIDSSGTTYYSYDLRGNVTSTAVTLGGNSFITQYQYNAADQLTQITYPDGRTLDYQYDLAGRLSQVDTTDNQGGNKTLLSAISYQPFGPLKDQTYGNGLTMAQASDLDYRQTSLTTPSVLERSYDFDNNSNITQITDNITANSQVFSYDNLNRLDQANDSDANYGAIDYQYDASHNRTAKNSTLNSLTDNESYQYQTSSNILASKTAGNVINYQYDANGNMTDNGHYQFSYGDNNRLKTVTQTNQIIASYTYNAQGQRVQKTTQTDTTYYLYGLQGELIAEVDTAGQLTKSYLFANGQLLAVSQQGLSSTIPTSPTEIVLDNSDASFSDLWTESTYGTGYQGNNYQYHSGQPIASPGVLGQPIDNSQASYTGSWGPSDSNDGYYHNGCQFHAGTALGTPEDTFTWPLNAEVTASYDVYATWPEGWNAATDAKFTIHHATGSDTVTVNQAQNALQWNLLGTYTLDAASSVSLSSQANAYLTADAVTILPAGTTPVVAPQEAVATWTPGQGGEYEIYANWADHSWRPTTPINATDAKYTINHANGSDVITVNQQQAIGQWNLLGTFTLATNSTISLSADANGIVIADGIKLVPTGTTTVTPQVAGLYYVHTDHLGTPQSLTDENQAIVWQAAYTPFGKATILTNTVENNIRFPGQYYDQETGLNYNYFRYYDPSLGRYITSDPIGLAGGINTYAYVGGNPLVYSDPNGLNAAWAWEAGWAAGTAAARSPWGKRATMWAVDAAWDAMHSDAGQASTEKERRAAAYNNYKSFAGRGYQKTGDPCKDLKSKIEFHKKLSEMKKSFDTNFPNSKFPAGRHAAEIARWERQIKEWTDEYNKLCGKDDFQSCP
jgi:RHS repeat-associated protein